MTEFEEMKKVVGDAYFDYTRTYRADETPDNLIYPRDKYPDVVSYIAFKVLEKIQTNANGKT